MISLKRGKGDTGLWLWRTTYNCFQLQCDGKFVFLVEDTVYPEKQPTSRQSVSNSITLVCIDCMFNSHKSMVIIHLEITFIVAPHQTVITWVLNCKKNTNFDLSMKEFCREFEFSYVSLQLWGCDQQTIIEAVVVWIVWYLDLQLPMQSVPITTNLPQARCTRYNTMK